jgi:hypothetical protein
MPDLTDYSSLKNEIDNAPEPYAAASGTEVKARIIKVTSGVSDKNDCVWHNVLFDCPDDPMLKEFSAFFWELNKNKLDGKQYQRAVYQFKAFAQAFGIDYSRPFSWEDDLIEKEGWVILGVKKSDEYGDQNNVKKFVSGPAEEPAF